MPKDWATCTFESDVEIAQLMYRLQVRDLPSGDDAGLLVPVHAYEYQDHFEEKGAQMALDAGDKDYRVTSAYFGDRNPVDLPYGDVWHEGRLKITDNQRMKAWFRNAFTDDWTVTGSQDAEKDHFEELDTMTEIQWDDMMDMPPVEKGEIATQWRWLRDTDGNWHRPDDVLSLQTGSNNDGDYAQIDFLVDQDDGTFYFFHYVEA